MSELLPCPFCGNDGSGPIEDALHITFSEHDWRSPSWSVQCDKCTATIGYFESEDEAVEAWNTRPRLSNLMEKPYSHHLVEKIRAKLHDDIDSDTIEEIMGYVARFNDENERLRKGLRIIPQCPAADDERPDITRWQTERSEWFGLGMREVITEYAEWRDGKEVEALNEAAMVKEAVTEYWGERCDTFEKGCPCCDAWTQLDALVAGGLKD